jgi:hypothetical protein
VIVPLVRLDCAPYASTDDGSCGRSIQQRLNFFPLPHGQGSFRPTFDIAVTVPRRRDEERGRGFVMRRPPPHARSPRVPPGTRRPSPPRRSSRPSSRRATAAATSPRHACRGHGCVARSVRSARARRRARARRARGPRSPQRRRCPPRSSVGRSREGGPGKSCRSLSGAGASEPSARRKPEGASVRLV